MKIAIIGLGLIGGSLAKAIKNYTNHTVLGGDLQEEILAEAKKAGDIDEILTVTNLDSCDLLLLAIYPAATVEYIESYQHHFKKGALLIDCCGIKRKICEAIEPLAQKNDFIFIGGHPMAGLEVAGYENAFAELFQDASMILTPPPQVDTKIVEEISSLFLTLGFGHIEITTPDLHDRNIAYTSQLAHVVSNAYVKSPGSLVHQGFSAGSYKDLTRVAKLEEAMWTELFLANKDYLLEEIDTLTRHLQEYIQALKNGDATTLQALLKAGKERKEQVH